MDVLITVLLICLLSSGRVKRQQSQIQSQDGQGGNQIQSQSQNAPGGSQFQSQTQGQGTEPIATPATDNRNQQNFGAESDRIQPQGGHQQQPQYQPEQAPQHPQGGQGQYAPDQGQYQPQGGHQPQGQYAPDQGQYQPQGGQHQPNSYPQGGFGSPFGVSPFGFGAFGQGGFPQQGFGFQQPGFGFGPQPGFGNFILQMLCKNFNFNSFKECSCRSQDSHKLDSEVPHSSQPEVKVRKPYPLVARKP